MTTIADLTIVGPPPSDETYRVVYSRDKRVFLEHEGLTLEKARELVRETKEEDFSARIQKMRWEDVEDEKPIETCGSTQTVGPVESDSC